MKFKNFLKVLIKSLIRFAITITPYFIPAEVQRKRYDINDGQYRALFSGVLLFTSLIYFNYKILLMGYDVYDIVMEIDEKIYYVLMFSTFFSILFINVKVDKLEIEAPRHMLYKTFYYPFLFVVFLLITSVYFMQSAFDGISLPQILFILNANTDKASNEFIKSFYRQAFLPAVGFAYLYNYCLRHLPKTFKVNIKREIRITVVKSPITIFLLLEAIYVFLSQTPFGDIHTNNNNFIRDHYIFPTKTNITFPEKKRNLVFVLLESIESSYSSKEYHGFFPNNDNLIPKLTKTALDPNNLHFSNNDLLGGTSFTNLAQWTAGGLFAAISGLPFKTDPTDPRNSFPRVCTLLELLESHGYDIFMTKGNRDGFGVGRVMMTHTKNFNFMVGPEIKKNFSEFAKGPTGFMNSITDYSLYAFSIEQMNQRALIDKPFAMFVEPTSTHMPSGYKCDHCKKKHKWQYYDVIQCADNETAYFLEQIKKTAVYNDTTVILLSDHLTMAKKMARVLGNFDRTMYNVILNSAVNATKKITRSRIFQSFDWFPTILTALGCKVEGHRLGMGTDLFSGEKTLAESLGLDYVNKIVTYYSEFFVNTFYSEDRKSDCVEVNGTLNWYPKTNK